MITVGSLGDPRDGLGEGAAEVRLVGRSSDAFLVIHLFMSDR